MSIREIEPTTYWVEFGPLDDEQLRLVEVHTMRAAGSEVSDDGSVVIEFSLRRGEAPQAAFDDIRGWAIGKRLPIRRLLA